MCGIIGYTGVREAADIVLGALDRLDYRGYDSAGLAIQNGTGLYVARVPGSVDGLRRRVKEDRPSGHCAIGHTRWATHGSPSLERNAHPHICCDGAIAIVHNGVIENAQALRSLLEARGHVFRSETDTEVLAHLVEEAEGDTLEERVLHSLPLVEGTYGMAAVWRAEPDKVVVARNGSPVLVGIGTGEYFLASDAAAVLEHTRSIVHLEDGDLAVLTPSGYRIIDLEARIQDRAVERIQWDLSEVDLGPHPNYMHKEIAEQPDAIARAIAGRLRTDSRISEERARNGNAKLLRGIEMEPGVVRLGGLDLTDREIEKVDRILMVACGTSWHSSLIARNAIQELSGIPVSVEYASEFRYLAGPNLRGTLTIAVSQSGETADTLEATRAARAAGSRVIGVVNVVGSTLARESESGVYLRAGPEIGVASTKAFTSQVIALLLIALRLGAARGLPVATQTRIAREMARIPDLLRKTLELEDQVEAIARVFHKARSFLYLGRGMSFPVALEGALKLKEISYIHAEGYPAAEMKHGPIALIDEAMPVVCVAPADHLLSKMRSNIQEVRARGGQIISVGTEGDQSLESISDKLIRVPATERLLSPLLTVVPLQLLAYHIALLRGCNVDRPRNLAKSVTVE